MYRLLIFILVLFPQHKFFAHPAPVRDRASVVSVRTISENKIAQWKSSKDFQYNRSESLLSWWDRLKIRFFQWLYALFSNENKNRAFWIGTITVCILIIVFAIYKLTGMSRSAMFERRSFNELAYRAGEEDIHEIDFNEEIKNAESTQNLRLAVRYRYLQLLKFLSDKGLIHWNANKTNHEYVAEMRQESVFADITYSFEYIWYGEREIDKKEYEDLKVKFEQQQKTI